MRAERVCDEAAVRSLDLAGFRGAHRMKHSIRIRKALLGSCFRVGDALPVVHTHPPFSDVDCRRESEHTDVGRTKKHSSGIQATYLTNQNVSHVLGVLALGLSCTVV